MRISAPSIVVAVAAATTLILMTTGCTGTDTVDSSGTRPSSASTSAGTGQVSAVRSASPGTAIGPASSSSSNGSPQAARDGDVDGDGRTESITLPAAGLLRVVYSTGRTEEVRFDSGPYPAAQGVLGSVDADRDGHAEVFVRFDQGAAMQLATAFRYVDARLRLVTLDGQQAALPYGASLRNAATWGCRRTQPPAAAIESWAGSSTNGKDYRGDSTFYNFSGSRLVTVGKSASIPPPEMLSCGSVTFK
ncbi:hypothetical protein [Protofrankia symbiont of Coriaria ruscifolia]|uniref:hypothetical protein n=1 Tax=Protofrankia symbiont of Coriaria ruscifolia TaxID=1306542 RepID=UPI0010411EE5|nr:hypothetical protein [Protofrankia symbiont of Coriaria ruscifolia]